MDPEACIEAVLGNLEDGDTEAAMLGLVDYTTWTSNGGFPVDTELASRLETSAGGWADTLDNTDAGWST